MGTRARQKPERLGEKLRTIREALGLSQAGIFERLEGMTSASQISEFETGKREPSLIVLLQYARLAGVYVDVLIDDKLKLPTKLPAKPKHLP